jgi:hypothetical protein
MHDHNGWVLRVQQVENLSRFAIKGVQTSA